MPLGYRHIRPFAGAIVLAYAVLAALILFGLIMLAAGEARSTTQHHRYTATVRCDRLAEDTAAHVRLVKYEPTDDGLVLVYRCADGGW